MAVCGITGVATGVHAKIKHETAVLNTAEARASCEFEPHLRQDFPRFTTQEWCPNWRPARVRFRHMEQRPACFGPRGASYSRLLAGSPS